eukprot:CAMPEP_0175224532 /NCGR_PEP_ID=MMETSP0093-20121207/21897_1 /TAXON_ID=311494 /ORGANISM="Alexandrium monilatum, Strain CCMP3105" /LENGTH=38 /DNA_ID= /DNA_START= /DNA_END= /DNA_ORIENTATION=
MTPRLLLQWGCVDRLVRGCLPPTSSSDEGRETGHDVDL